MYMAKRDLVLDRYMIYRQYYKYKRELGMSIVHPEFRNRECIYTKKYSDATDIALYIMRFHEMHTPLGRTTRSFQGRWNGNQIHVDVDPQTILEDGTRYSVRSTSTLIHI